MIKNSTINEKIVDLPNGKFCISSFGSGAKPLVLINGLGMQIVRWPNNFLQKLADEDITVYMVDNRDVGLSMQCDDQPQYSLSDLADDIVQMMDYQKLDKAHIVGVSLGGMIGQRLTLRHPNRVLSFISFMSSTTEKDLEQIEAEVVAALTTPPPSNDKPTVLKHGYQAAKLWQSPKWPTEESEHMQQSEIAFDRCYYPPGVNRQYTAILADMNVRASELMAVKNPVKMMALHGDSDKLVPCSHGKRTAQIMKGEYVEIEGLGHNLPDPALDIIVGHIVKFINS